MLNLNTVAAGGGSKLFVRNGLLVVGPEVSFPHEHEESTKLIVKTERWCTPGSCML